MATLFEPVPTIAPQTNAAPAMGIRADADAFGAGIGRAVSGLGESIQGAAKTGMDALIAEQHLRNEIHASEANTWLADKITERYGEYSKLEGKSSLDALPQFKKDIDQLYTDHLSTAPSLQERAMLARNGKQLTARYYGWAEQRAAGQFRTWQDKTSVDRAASYGNVAGLAAANSDDEGMAVALNTSDDEVRKLYEGRGWPKQEIEQEVAKNRGRNLKQIIETQSVEDPMGAVARFKQMAPQMDAATRLSTSNHLRPIVTKLRGREIADEELGRAPQSAGAGPGMVIQKFTEAGYTPEQAAAVAGHFFHESANNPRAVHDGGIGIGIAGWNGERRAGLEAFAKKRGKDATDFETQVDFAIHELDTSEAPAGQALRGAKTLEDATTAFMHFERPKGYTRDNPRGGDSYDSRLTHAARFANGDYSGALPPKNIAFERIAGRTQDNPALQDAALAWANKVYSANQTERTHATAEFKTRWADTTQEAMRTGNVASPLTLQDFIVHLGPAEAAKGYREYQTQLQFGTDAQSLAGMSHEEQEELLQRYAVKPGQEGYAEAAKREDSLVKEINRVRGLRAKDPDFKARIDASIAEAGRTGSATNPVKRAEFEQRLGIADGAGAFAQYSASLRLGKDASSLADLSPAETKALVESYQPQGGDEDYQTQAKRYDALVKARDAVVKEANDDPGGFAMQRLPAVKESYVKMTAALSAKDISEGERRAAVDNFVNVTLAEQARIGIAADDRAVLPKEIAEQMSTDIMRPAQAGGVANVNDNIEAQVRIWDKNWPQVYKQIQKDVAPIVRVIGSGIDPRAARKLTEVAPLKLPQILKDEDTEKASKIKADVLKAFKPLAASMVGWEDRLPIFNDFRSQAEKLAAYYVVDGKDSGAAAEQAYKDLVLYKYQFANGYRIPKNIPQTPDQIVMGAQAVKNLLGKPIPGMPEGRFAGQLEPGNIDLDKRPVVKNRDGSISTVRSMSANVDGREVVLPTVSDDGRTLSADETIEQFRKTGKHLGKFDTSDNATAYAKAVHDQQQKRYSSPFDLPSARDTFGGLRPEYLAGTPAEAYQRDGVWVTAPGDTGLMLVYKDEAVRTKAGTPLIMSWQQLADHAKAPMAQRDRQFERHFRAGAFN